MKITKTFPSDISGREQDMIVVIPVGLIEYHGEHIALGTDIMIPEMIVEVLDKKIDDLLLMPSIPYGVEEKHADLVGTIPVSSEVFKGLLIDIILGMELKGFGKFFILNGHKGNEVSISDVKDMLKIKYANIKLEYKNWWEEVDREILSEVFPHQDKFYHGGVGETSVMMVVEESLVDLEKVKFEYLDRDKVDEYFTETGCYADPSEATLEKGKQIVDNAISNIVKFIRDNFK